MSTVSTIEFTAQARRGLRAVARHRAVATGSATRRAVKRGAPELRTLVKFTAVGGSGYLVNLIAFAAAQKLGADHIVAATVAFLAAVGNNFHWNRRWTFSAVGTEAIHRQARRFLLVSTISFLFSLGILELLVEGGVVPLIAQAISIAVAMPFAFVANRVWTFAEPGTLRRHARLRRERQLARRAAARQTAARG
jgi:putative flippase GtrA